MQYIIYNNEIMEDRLLNIAIDNRSFRYGDGIFESMSMRNGRISFFKEHLERFTNGIKALGMVFPEGFEHEKLELLIMEVAKKNKLDSFARIRLQAWRAGGGMVKPMQNNFEYLVTVSSYMEKADVVDKLIVYRYGRTAYSVFSQYKNNNYLVYIMAAMEAEKRGAEDAILLDTAGHIAECTTSNIFWIEANILYTPSLNTGCVAGVMRKKIIELCRNLGYVVNEGLFKVEQMMHKADSVFISNSSGTQIVKQVEDKILKLECIIYERIKRELNAIY
jgi:branched-chain amino acid aminotransferase/4-amino-4-deoxychorismate lyase